MALTLSVFASLAAGVGRRSWCLTSRVLIDSLLTGWQAKEWVSRSWQCNREQYSRILSEKLEMFMTLHGTTHFLQDGGNAAKY